MLRRDDRIVNARIGVDEFDGLIGVGPMPPAGASERRIPVANGVYRDPVASHHPRVLHAVAGQRILDLALPALI